MYTPDQIATASGAPLANVQTSWPLLVAALNQFGINDHPTRVAVIATVSRETGQWLPIPEYDSGEKYEGRQDLGNVNPGDGPRFKGRGFIQLTGRKNYRDCGHALKADLENNPDLALDPHTAALALAWFFVANHIPEVARAGTWEDVQTRVNGGYWNYQEIFLPVLNAILAIPEPPDAPPVTTVAVAGALKTEPNHTSPAAIDGQHQPVQLAVGTVIEFCPDPGEGKPWSGQITAGDWAHLRPHNSPAHGWYLRESLATTGA